MSYGGIGLMGEQVLWKEHMSYWSMSYSKICFMGGHVLQEDMPY